MKIAVAKKKKKKEEENGMKRGRTQRAWQPQRCFFHDCYKQFEVR